MVDPFVITALIIGILQLGIQLSSYVQERKKRKQEEQQQVQHRQILSSSASMFTYRICYPQAYILPSPSPCSSSSRSQPSPFNFPSSYNWLELLGGRLQHLPPLPQQAPLAHYGGCNMRTSASDNNDFTSCYHHWKSLQENSCDGQLQKGIAVVDWDKGNIDMFMEIGGTYYRNYRINSCEVATFAREFKEREVFSGSIKEEKLERFNKEMKMVEILGGVRSTNSWTRLGIDIEESDEDLREVLSEEVSFLQMVRGALFGLLCCLYMDPSHLNVDMHTTPYQHLHILRITSHPQHPCLKRPTCLFSVFSLGDSIGWASQDIFVG